MKSLIQRIFLTLALSMVLVACGGGGAAAPSPGFGTGGSVTSEVSNEVARIDIVADAGASLTVVATTTVGVRGAKIDIPAGAAVEDIQLQIGYEDALPGAFRAEAVSSGAKQVSKVLHIKVANGKASVFKKPVEITLPYDTALAGGLPPAVLYWDPTANKYRAVSVIAVDRVAGTVKFRTSHFSRFVAVVLDTLKVAIPSYDTGFRMGRDSILHQNFGSYEFGGHCMAFASMASHYFSLNKTKNLYTLAQDGDVEQPNDDELTRTALAMTHALLSEKWDNVIKSFDIPSKADTGLLVWQALVLTGSPVHFSLRGGGEGHSVTAFGYDKNIASFNIYDSNFPKETVTFAWNQITGFGSYSKNVYAASMFDNIGFTTDDTFGAPAEFQKIISDWESGAIKDKFAFISVKPVTGTLQNLTFGSAVSLTIPYLDGQTVTGVFTRPPGSTKPVYLHEYRGGKKVADKGVLLDQSGSFIISFANKLASKLDIMLMISENQRDPMVGFTAFGKFTVQAQGQNFFRNFGFETGSTVNWNATTSFTYSDTSLFYPTKVTVVSAGFDPIATDLPMTQFGRYALRINDATPDYHKTLLSQSAVVPASGNSQLSFRWAAVLEDPAHSASEQPYVDVVVKNMSTGAELYRKRYFTNDPTYTGWKDYQGGTWKAIPWQTVILNLSAFAGNTIQLSITAADCALGAHGGYLYFDGEE